MRIIASVLLVAGLAACGPAEKVSKTMELSQVRTDFGGVCNDKKRWTECGPHLTAAEASGGE